MAFSTSATARWTILSSRVATDDSYCPSCNRVSACSGVVRVCPGQGRIHGFTGVIMSGSADSYGGGLVPLGPVPWPGTAGGRVQGAGARGGPAGGRRRGGGPRGGHAGAGGPRGGG